LFGCPSNCPLVSSIDVYVGDSFSYDDGTCTCSGQPCECYPDASDITATLYMTGLAPAKATDTDGVGGRFYASWDMSSNYGGSLIEKIVLSDDSGEWTIAGPF